MSNRIRHQETLEQLGQVGPHHVAHWSNDTAITGVAQEIIPAGVEDVTAILTIVYAVERVTAGLSSNGVNGVVPGANVNLYSVGGNILTVTVAAGGQATIAVSGGADTFNVSLWLLWV